MKNDITCLSRQTALYEQFARTIGLLSELEAPFAAGNDPDDDEPERSNSKETINDNDA